MPINGPIVVVEDDLDDQESLADALRDLNVPNKVLFFDNTRKAYNYLISGEQPFLIICDINLPGQNGIEFKRQIDADPVLCDKSIPFVYFTTHANPEVVKSAYRDLTVQGFFRKPSSFQAYKKLLEHLIAYWQVCCHPND